MFTQGLKKEMGALGILETPQSIKYVTYFW